MPSPRWLYQGTNSGLSWGTAATPAALLIQKWPEAALGLCYLVANVALYGSSPPILKLLVLQRE